MDFSFRETSPELMDDFSITDDRLTMALEQLPKLNRFLGAHAVVKSYFKHVLRNKVRQLDARPSFSVLDIGSGIGDIPVMLVRWTAQRDVAIDVTATDANPFTRDYGETYVNRNLPVQLRDRVSFHVADALALPFPNDSFDYVIASQLLHHFDQGQATQIVSEMNRVSRSGILVNDLHRHPMAFYSIKLVTRAFGMSPMIVNDAPISVHRGFTRAEIKSIFAEAGLPEVVVNWRPAFRWSASTQMKNGASPPSERA